LLHQVEYRNDSVTNPKWLPADNLKEAGWSWGCVSAIDLEGRTIWIVDAHGYGKRFIVRADEDAYCVLELERAVCIHLLTKQV
jgi:hypothetical protein